MIKYVNPYIKVVWEDNPENFTHEKINRLKTYFGEKFKTKHVRIVPKHIINNNDVKLESLEVSDKILEPLFQKKLMKDFIKENEIDVKWETINRLDDKVNMKFSELNESSVKHNRWAIKKVEFSNFLSFGKDNTMNYEELKGITVIESIPKNFGGKTTSTVDLILFLLFGVTTKTKTLIEVFNRYTSENELWVRGTIDIDNETYVIERKLIRKKKPKGNEYTVTNKMDFYKVGIDGELEILNDERRDKTEKIIISAIGTEEDFLLTILTTGGNLEELIESKPTARGQILSKFLGLESLKKKEEIGKEMHSTWAKTLTSNNFNIVDLQNKNVSFDESIVESKQKIKQLNLSIEKNTGLLKTNEDRKEKLLSDKTNDVDNELIKTNPDQINSDMKKIDSDMVKTTTEIDSINVTEPNEYYDEEKHDLLTEKINTATSNGLLYKKDIDNNIKLINQLRDDKNCPTCKQEISGWDVKEKEIQRIEKENLEIEEKMVVLRTELKKLNGDNVKFKDLKLQFSEYEKNKIIKSRHEITLEQLKLDKQKKEISLKNYNDNKTKFEKNKKIDEEVINLKTVIETLKATLESDKKDISSHEHNITTMTDNIKTNKDLIKKIEFEQEYSNIFKIYLNIFGKNGISKVILKNMIPLLNEELSVLLSDSSYFTLELNVNDKNEVEFLMIDNETRVTKPLNSGSGYEKTISSLALRSVMTKVSTLPKPNIVVMDEIFGKVADENLEMVGEFFKKIKKYFEHIFLISHNPLIRNWSDNVVTIKKENNVSFIENIIV